MAASVASRPRISLSLCATIASREMILRSLAASSAFASAGGSPSRSACGRRSPFSAAESFNCETFPPLREAIRFSPLLVTSIFRLYQQPHDVAHLLRCFPPEHALRLAGIAARIGNVARRQEGVVPHHVIAPVELEAGEGRGDEILERVGLPGRHDEILRRSILDDTHHGDR